MTACRIGLSLERVELDCTVPGRITGVLRVLGIAGPVALDLRGDAQPDLAGARVEIENPAPEEGDGAPLATEQRGEAVLLTLSRRIRLARGPRAATAPLRNVVHLEWNSATNGRVVVSGGGWTVRVITPAPPAPPGATPVNSGLTLVPGAEEDPSAGPLDEFEWERSLRDADEMVDTYMQLEREYEGHPDKERLLARDMGWSWLEDSEVQRTLGELEANPPADAEEQYPELVPNPATEGVDWIRTPDGDIRHPLSDRALTFAVALWKELDARRGGVKGDPEREPQHPDVSAFLFNVQALSAKLAGALNDLMYDCPPDGPCVAAYLKRALGYLNQSANSLELIERRALLPPERAAEHKATLMLIRQEILRLMDHYRKMA